MRIILGSVLLLAMACDQEPTPADVAGVYELTLDGERVIPDEYRWFLEFKPDGTFVSVDPDRPRSEINPRSGTFSISGAEAGCVDISWEAPPVQQLYRRGDQVDTLMVFMNGDGTICGDTLTHQPEMDPEGGRHVLIFVKRR